MFGNQLYVPAVNPNRSFGNDEHGNLLRLDEVTGTLSLRAAHPGK